MEEGLAVPVVRNLPLSEVGSLEPARYPVKLTVYDERMKAYMEGLQRLSAQDGERTELLVAAYRARVAANELLDPEDRETVRKDYRLESLQEDGGVKLLPLAEGDAAVTAKMLVVAPELINKADAVAFLRGKLADASSTPDERVMSYLGLAAAGGAGAARHHPHARAGGGLPHPRAEALPRGGAGAARRLYRRGRGL